MIALKLITLIISIYVQCCLTYQESACAAVGGTCKEAASCSGTSLTGKCPTQPANIKCCITGGSGGPRQTGSNNCGGNRLDKICGSSNALRSTDCEGSGSMELDAGIENMMVRLRKLCAVTNLVLQDASLGILLLLCSLTASRSLCVHEICIGERACACTYVYAKIIHGACICICHVYLYACAYVHVYMYVYACVHVYMYVCICTCVHVCIACVHVYLYAYACVHVYMYVLCMCHVYMYAYAFVHVYMCI